jgi:hypothetical protein
MSQYKNWPVPHSARLEKAMEPGQLVAIKGDIPEIDLKADEEADPRITINLAASGDGYDASDVPLQICIRFRHNELIFNSKKNGEWGKEEKKKNPFKLGGKMDLRVRAHGDKFEILVDQKDFAFFEHRSPLSTVDHMFIDGSIALHGVNWGGKYYSVPFETGISGGFGTGKRLLMSGVPEKKAETFSINLITDSGDIALHINPRFNKKEVVRNSRKGGEWQNEEKESAFPFKHEVVFDLVIVNEAFSFQILLNDEMLCTFAHRLEPKSIVGLMIDGEVELQSIMVV